MSEAGLESAAPPFHWAFRIRAALFDLDGTLVDSAPDLVSAINRMLSELGRAPADGAQVRSWIGDGARRLVAHALCEDHHGTLNESLISEAYRLFQQYYAQSVCVDSVVYPGVRTTLQELKSRGIALALVTNKPRRFTEPLLDQIGLRSFFGAVVSGDDMPEKKPDPAPLKFAAQQLNVPVSACVLVGDSTNDIRAARAAGIPVLWVSYGYGNEGDLEQDAADAVIDVITELKGRLSITT